jgi:hypothetical protein
MVAFLVNFMKMMIELAIRRTEMMANSAKHPSAHFATNQKSEAKQKSEDGMKKATSPVIRSKVFQIARHIATIHFPLGGNGLARSPRSAVSTPKINWT